jgi:hypothetical protein
MEATSIRMSNYPQQTLSGTTEAKRYFDQDKAQFKSDRAVSLKNLDEISG